jgi:hypothetical protein
MNERRASDCLRAARLISLAPQLLLACESGGFDFIRHMRAPMGRTPKATKDLGDSKKDLGAPLKDWAKEIFVEGQDWGPLLMDRASSLAGQAIEECEGDISASSRIIPIIWTMLTNRYLRQDMIYTRWHYSHLQKQAKAIMAAIKKIESALTPENSMALNWFPMFYNATYPPNHLKHHDEFLPDWDRFVRGLLHLKQVSESQNVELTKWKNDPPPSNWSTLRYVFGHEKEDRNVEKAPQA